MKKFFIPVIVMLAGTFLIAQPMVRGSCGIDPQPYIPGQCNPPYTEAAGPTQSMCFRMSDGTCTPMNCSGEIWENAIPGKCGQAIITENGVPACLSNYAATAITVNRYTTACSTAGGNCTCIRTATGQSTTVTVCTCKDLPAMH